MNRIAVTTINGALALALAGCGGPAPAPEASTSDAPATASTATPAPAAGAAPATAAADAAPAAFAQCRTCHAIEPGKAMIGPSLAGVYGRKAGSVAGFAYSDGLKALGKSWDDATLDAWLTAPMKLVPGTKMTFPGIADPSQRQAVINYLKTLK
ncbi:MAG: c-type cytochrome [Sphingomonadales bacterium]|nr:c-type cytochrome [Sphingomonadales bacterium]